MKRTPGAQRYLRDAPNEREDMLRMGLSLILWILFPDSCKLDASVRSSFDRLAFRKQ